MDCARDCPWCDYGALFGEYDWWGVGVYTGEEGERGGEVRWNEGYGTSYIELRLSSDVREWGLFSLTVMNHKQCHNASSRICITIAIGSIQFTGFSTKHHRVSHQDTGVGIGYNREHSEGPATQDSGCFSSERLLGPW